MTTCPDFDRLALDADALAAHLSACSRCADALAEFDDAPVAELAVLRDVRCPPDVVASALRQSRRAPDRPVHPAPARRRRRGSFVWAVPVLALGLAMAWWVQGPSETANVVAVRPDTTSPTPTSEAPVPVAVEAPVAAVATPPDEDVVPVSRPTPSRSRFSRVPPSAPPSVDPVDADASTLPADAFASDVSPADSAAAVDGLRLALAVVGDARRDAADIVAAELARPREALAYSISRP